ncbi:MAG: response regulator transcription factor [Myxococcota bacterium]
MQEATPKQILVVEDDASIVTGLSLNLRYEGYVVEVARDGRVGLEKALRGNHDLIILDVMLPEVNGFELLKTLRQSGKSTRVLMLSAKGTEADKVTGLQTGADDYLSKPFGLQELLARVAALLRRPAAPGPSLVRFGKVEADFSGGRVTRNGEAVPLTSTELALLRCLVERPGRVQSREHLLRAAWGDDYEGTTRTVDNFIRALRLKLEDDPEAPKHLMTVRGMGYRFDP